MNNSESTPITTKAADKTLPIVRGAILGFLLGTCISVVPVCGIRRSPALVFTEPAQTILFIEWIIVSAITGGALIPNFFQRDPLFKSSEVTNLPKRLLRLLIMPITALLFLSLYFAACGLCQRMDMGVIGGGQVINQTLRFLGLLISTVGLAIQSFALVTSARSKTDHESANGYVQSPIFQLRHPCFFATLVALSGIPLALGTWYPLFALPGIFIVMKWIVTEQERVLVEKYGTAYEQYQNQTRRLLPYIY